MGKKVKQGKASKLTYLIIYDNGGVYEPNTKIKAGDLVKHYIESLNEKNDKDVIDWLTNYMSKDDKMYADFAMMFIAEAWDLSIDGLNDMK